MKKCISYVLTTALVISFISNSFADFYISPYSSEQLEAIVKSINEQEYTVESFSEKYSNNDLKKTKEIEKYFSGFSKKEKLIFPKVKKYANGLSLVYEGKIVKIFPEKDGDLKLVIGNRKLNVNLAKMSIDQVSKMFSDLLYEKHTLFLNFIFQDAYAQWELLVGAVLFVVGWAFVAGQEKCNNSVSKTVVSDFKDKVKKTEQFCLSLKAQAVSRSDITNLKESLVLLSRMYLERCVHDATRSGFDTCRPAGFSESCNAIGAVQECLKSNIIQYESGAVQNSSKASEKERPKNNPIENKASRGTQK